VQGLRDYGARVQGLRVYGARVQGMGGTVWCAGGVNVHRAPAPPHPLSGRGRIEGRTWTRHALSRGSGIRS
jgi:hypothetical protein